MTSRVRWSRLAGAIVVLALATLGVLGAASYGQAYQTNRGFVSIAHIAGSTTGRLVNVNFYSPALHRRAFYMVYLPPHYDPAKRYPVYYLLHGSPSRPQVFINLAGMDVRLDNLLLRGDVKPMILVFPDGRMGGSYMSDSEWANTPSGNFESYVVNVVHDVDQRFSTLPFRQYRDIAGFSEGAYGAINVALHHLDLFENVQVWSGYFTETRTGVFAHASSATLAYNSPLDYVHTLAASFTQFPTRIYMFVGRQDDSSSQMAPMDRALARVGADVSDRFFSGGHDWQLWWSQINPMIVRASRDMSHPLPAADARRVALVARATGGRRHHPAAHHRHFGASQHPARVHIAKPLALRAGALSVPAVRSAHAGESLRAGLLVGLVLAIVSAAMINLGFLLQHRGLVGGSDDGRRSLLRAFRSGAWLGGQALGWAGFALQILAVALAPLSLVQAFAAGGLAISVPLAAGLFHQRLSRNQIIAVAITAASLALLPLGLPRVAGRTHPGLLIVAALVAPAIAALLVAIRRPMMRAIAAGIFYGVADAGIKAEAIAVRAHGIGALASGWTLVAVLGTFVGFLAFQSALREGHPVSAISLMTALTALTALGFGVFAFGESLGRTPAVTIVHLLAIGLVLACVPVLGAAQAEESANRDRSPRLPDGGLGRRAAFLAGGGVAAALLLVLAIVVDVGLLYGLRELRWLAFGPHIPDALPLLQLAGFDRQPLGRVAIASLLAGLMFGLAISSVRPLTRTAAVGLLGTLLLLIASDASFALARNLPFSQVLDGRVPGFGPWLQGALFTVGVALPGLVAVRVPRSLPRLIAGQGIARGEPAGSL